MSAAGFVEVRANAQAAAAQPWLTVEDVSVAYSAAPALLRRRRRLLAVQEVDLHVPRGGALGIVGESGCGKSSLARVITGLLAPSAGRVTLAGVDLHAARGAARRALRRRVQMVFQDPLGSLNPRRTVGQTLSEPLIVHGLERGAAGRRARVAALLHDVGLSESLLPRYPHELSGGQRQRVCIARGLALRPEVLVCDEPVSALDVSIQAQVVNLLADLRQRLGLTLLLISHNLAVVRFLCDEIAVMYLGRIVEQAPTAALFREPRHPYTQALLAASRGRLTDADGPGQGIRGEPPDPLHPPPGCAYEPRCPLAEPGCAREIPRLSPEQPRQAGRVACFVAQRRALAPATFRPIQ